MKFSVSSLNKTLLGFFRVTALVVLNFLTKYVKYPKEENHTTKLEKSLIFDHQIYEIFNLFGEQSNL
jgi:hypothetical protein